MAGKKLTQERAKILWQVYSRGKCVAAREKSGDTSGDHQEKSKFSEITKTLLTHSTKKKKKKKKKKRKKKI